ncbi:MAG: ATP-binding protein [Faecousia sp.]
MNYEITFSQLEKLEKPKIIDIRTPEQFAHGSYPGAENIPREMLRPEDYRQPIYLLCQSGILSLELAEQWQEMGIQAVSIHGGYREYLRQTLARTVADEAMCSERRKKAEHSIITTYRKELWTPFIKAIKEYQLISDGDRIAVCISGGKDSMLMAKLFQELRAHGRQNFEVVFLVMNPGYNQVNHQAVLENAKLLGIPIEVFHTEIFDFVAKQGGSPCYLCARMRRGHLYSKAKELGCNKIALGHHYDDVIETILMGMLYGGQIQTMMPKLHSTNFPGMELIRPMYLIREKDILRWRDYNDLHFIQCACRLTENCASCGGTEKGSKRAEIKQLIHSLSQQDAQIPARIFRSVENVNLDTVIAYKQANRIHHFLDDYEEN